jgi:hypothetical protein
MFLQTSITTFQLMFSTSWVGLYSRAGGLASAVALCLFFFCIFSKKKYQHCRRLIYTSCGTGISIFKPIFGTFVFFFNLSIDGLVWKLPVLGRVANFFAFQLKVFGCGRAKLCEIELVLHSPTHYPGSM